jgi:hypothetical protein
MMIRLKPPIRVKCLKGTGELFAAFGDMCLIRLADGLICSFPHDQWEETDDTVELKNASCETKEADRIRRGDLVTVRGKVGRYRVTNLIGHILRLINDDPGSEDAHRQFEVFRSRVEKVYPVTCPGHVQDGFGLKCIICGVSWALIQREEGRLPNPLIVFSEEIEKAYQGVDSEKYSLHVFLHKVWLAIERLKQTQVA